MNSVNEQLELGKLKVAVSDKVAHGVGSYAADIKSVLLQRFKVAVQALALGFDIVCGKLLLDFGQSKRVLLVGFFKQDFLQI